MRTMTLCAVAAALAIGTTLAGVGFVQSRQLGTGDDVLGRGGAVAGREGTVSDTATAEDQRAVAPAALGECVTNRTAFRTQTNLVATTSTAFVLMPNTHFPVTTSGGCLIVDFSAELTTIVDTSIQIRASIAGIGEAQPPSAFMERNYDGTLPWRVHSMRFVFPNVPAGQHVVRIEFRSTENEVYAATRTLTVQYRP